MVTDVRYSMPDRLRLEFDSMPLELQKVADHAQDSDYVTVIQCKCSDNDLLLKQLRKQFSHLTTEPDGIVIGGLSDLQRVGGAGIFAVCIGDRVVCINDDLAEKSVSADDVVGLVLRFRIRRIPEMKHFWNYVRDCDMHLF